LKSTQFHEKWSIDAGRTDQGGAAQPLEQPWQSHEIRESLPHLGMIRLVTGKKGAVAYLAYVDNSPIFDIWTMMV
jgi:hypothetical protein